MAAYITPIRFALMVFPFLAFAISSVFFVYEYRKYGTFIISRAIVLYSFVFYLLCAYFLVILPLPSRAVVAQMTGPRMELHLFQSWRNFAAQTVLIPSDPATYVPALKQSVFLEPFFNIMLLVPFGVYLNYYFRFSFWKTILASFCLSLFFELTQLSGLYFIYPRPYRLFDVNDLLHNTLGGAFGYVLAPVITFMLPTRAKMDERSYEKGKVVSLGRRLVAAGIDFCFLFLLDGVISLLGMLPGLSILENNLVSFFLEIILYFVCFAYLLNGQTFGKKIVRIRVVGTDGGRAGFVSLLIRYSYLYLLIFSLGQLGNFMVEVMNTSQGILYTSAVFIFIGTLLISGLFFLNLGLSFLLRKRVLFYEKASRTHVISTIIPKSEKEFQKNANQ